MEETRQLLEHNLNRDWSAFRVGCSEASLTTFSQITQSAQTADRVTNWY